MLRPSPVLFACALTSAVAACSDDAPSTQIDATSPIDAGVDTPTPANLVPVATIRGSAKRDLDLLFVVDNSGSMGEEQMAITAAFPSLVNALSLLPGGLPNLHLGVISTNVGSSPHFIGGCTSPARPQGDDGLLLTNGCPALHAGASYVSDVSDGGGGRTRNYDGALPDVFSCMAQLGINGCGFEQPLEAIRRALSPGRNPGFLRPDALLAIVILSDEDDCSVLPGSALFGEPNATINDPLGPRTSFRCFEFGVECDNDPSPRVFGTRTGCRPRASSPYMPGPQDFIDFVRALKADPSDIVVETITGYRDLVGAAVVGPDPADATRPWVEPSCVSANGAAAPAFRTLAFLDGFPGRSFAASICNEALTDAGLELANLVQDAQGSDACLTADLADVRPELPGVQPRCEVTQYTVVGGVRTDPVPLPECPGATPCYRLVADAACSADPAVALQIDRGGAPAPADSLVEARCEVAP